MSKLSRTFHISTVHVLATLLVVGLALGFAAVADAQCAGRFELRMRGEVASVDLALEQFTAIDNVTGAIGRTFQTDGGTQFTGTVSSLSEMVPQDQVDVRWCVVGTGPYAARVDDTGAALGPNGQIIDLNVPPGTESEPVARVYGEDGGERFGGGTPHGIAFGDVNGDGYADMIIGASSRARPGAQAGAVDIIYGGPNVLGASVDLNTDGVISIHGETRILPSAGGQEMGFAVASGDVDGDGFNDVFIGSTSGHGTGQVHIVYGSAQLPGTIISLDVNAAGSGDTLILGQGQEETTGSALASGDINGDGLADVIIGAPGRTQGSVHLGGTVFVLYGDPALRGATVDLDTNDAISAAGETRIFGERGEDRAGTSVAAGDVNGDGYADIVIGAGRADSLSTTDRGAAYVVYGSTALPGTVVDFGVTIDQVGPAGETRIWGRSANNLLGTVVATGDVNNDGFDDVIVGAPGVAGPGDNFAVGEVYVLYGSASLPASIIDLRNPVGASGETQITGLEEFGEFANSIGSADINGDGFYDLVLGAPGADPLGSLPETNSVFDGALYVLLGNAALAGQHLIDIREVADIIVLADSPNDRWGSPGAAGGDINRDGVPEYAAAAFLGDNPSILSAGNASGYVAAITGQASVPSTIRIKHSIAGDAPPADFGPVVRTVIDFDAGPAASRETVTLTRSAPDTATLPVGIGTALPVQWEVASDRSGFAADLTLSYTDTELGAADEALLDVYTSPDGTAGSWTVAGLTVTRDALRNTLTVTAVDTPGLFAIVVDPAGTRPDPVPGTTPGPGPGTIGSGSSGGGGGGGCFIETLFR